MDALKLLVDRRSIIKFTDEKVGHNLMREIIEDENIKRKM